MFIFYRRLGAFLAGTFLAGSVAQAQLFGLDCFEEPGCAVVGPNCAVGQVDCAPSCVPARPPIHYEICPPMRPMPCAPVTYHVCGPNLSPSGCADIPCAPPVHYQVFCAPAKPAPCVGPIPCVSKLSCTPAGCAQVDCTTTSCAPGRPANFGGQLFGGNGFGMNEAKGQTIVPTAGHASVQGYHICWEMYPTAGHARLPQSIATAPESAPPGASPILTATSAARLYSVRQP